MLTHKLRSGVVLNSNQELIRKDFINSDKEFADMV